MQLSEFVILSVPEKWSYCCTKLRSWAAEKILRREIYLFQLEGYNVELMVAPGKNDLEDFRIFTGTALPTPYLEHI